MDIECDAGCGVVPFRYRDGVFVNALQWAIGLELFLRVTGPVARIPSPPTIPTARPFTQLPAPHPAADGQGLPQPEAGADPSGSRGAHSELAGLGREYSLFEIAIMTAPRRHAASGRRARASRRGRRRRHHRVRRPLPTARRCSRHPSTCSRTGTWWRSTADRENQPRARPTWCALISTGASKSPCRNYFEPLSHHRLRQLRDLLR